MPENPQASYYRARYYDPNAGRFLSEDPLEFSSSDNNLYAYVWNDATSFSDPFGLCPPQTKQKPKPCFAQMKYRPVDNSVARKYKATHAFWWVQDSTGTHWTISAGPSNYATDTGPLGPLVALVAQGDKSAMYPKEDIPSATTAFDSGLSPKNCAAVDKLLAAARNFPGIVPYDPAGPNSNSAAHGFGVAAGFVVAPPPGSVGWDAPLW